jgi:hypothetical protein
MRLAAVLALVLGFIPTRGALAAGLEATPAQVRLVGPLAQQQLLISQAGADPMVRADRTGAALYESLNPKVAQVSKTGLISPTGDGAARIRVRLGKATMEVPVTVREASLQRPLEFVRDIAPILSRGGCNAGTCHGKAEGRGGLKLSVFGYDLPADHTALTLAGGGRRIARSDPARSLMLLKATGSLPHGGGRRFGTDSRYFRLLAKWIGSGAPYGPDDAPILTRLEILPVERAVSPNAVQSLLVTARYSDGSTRDVTREARFNSNSLGLATVDEEGRVTSTGQPGEAAVMAAYAGQVAVSRIRIPRPIEPGGNAARLPEFTPIDRLVWNRLEKLRIRPSSPASNEEFVRRAYLDAIGTLPSPEETRAFLKDCGSDQNAHHGETATRSDGGAGGEIKNKISVTPLLHYSTTPASTAARGRLIDALLARPEYADYWALKWADLLRVNKDVLGAKGAYAFYQWIRGSMAANVPYDRFVRELVTASGNSAENGAVNYYRVLTKPQDLAASTSQVFLGVRLECAQCHHHPFERWSQDDYYGMVAYFTRLQQKAGGPGASVLVAGGDGEATNPRTQKVVPPHPLLGAPEETSTAVDRREKLAEWLTAPNNPFLAKMIVNRIWAGFMGRGLVEPVDDFRETNPPSNPELLDFLAKELIRSKFDVKAVMRLIMTSQVYQLSAATNPSNAGDEQNFSRAYPKRLSAEVLLDAITQATGTPPNFAGLPRGARAVQMWDSEWSLQWQSYFLNAFGRPPRTSPCECERSQDPTIAQVLHLMNAPEIQAQLAGREGRARTLSSSKRSDDEVIEELFLAAYCRRPNPKELAAAREALRASAEDRSRAAEDLLWALLNSTEFVFNH